MRIGFATRDWSNTYRDERGVPEIGGAGWYRTAMPAEKLAARGHETTLGTLARNERSGRLCVKLWESEGEQAFVDGLDVLVMQRWMLDTLTAEVRRAVADGQTIVNDVDDWFWGLDPDNSAFRATHPKVNPHVNVEHYRKILASSSAITVSTPFLEEKMRDMFPEVPVHLVRNGIDLERWICRADDDAGRTPTVGWIGALPWRSRDLETLRGIVPPFMRAHGLPWFHGGHLETQTWGTAAEAIGLPEDWPGDTAPMLPIGAYPRLFQRLDVCLVPMSDKPFNHAKSAIKGMECAAAGVPFVASSTPEYEWLRTEHGIGRTAKNGKMWRRHLEELLDPEAREADRLRNRAAVERLDARETIVALEEALFSARGAVQSPA